MNKYTGDFTIIFALSLNLAPSIISTIKKNKKNIGIHDRP